MTADDGFAPTARYGGRHGPIHSNRSPTVPANVATTLDTMQKAAQMRAAGATFREIGRALDIHYTYARTLVLKALEQAEYEAADLMRTQEGQRLDRLQRAWWAKALDGDEGAARVVLRIMQQRARLFGLDAPTQVEVTERIPETAGIDESLRVILGQLAQEQPDAAGG